MVNTPLFVSLTTPSGNGVLVSINGITAIQEMDPAVGGTAVVTGTNRITVAQDVAEVWRRIETVVDFHKRKEWREKRERRKNARERVDD